MKRKIAVLLSGLLLLTSVLTSCSGGDKSGSDSSGKNAPSSEKIEASTPTDTSDEKTYDLKVSGHPYIHALASEFAIKQGYIKLKDPTVDMYASGPVQNEAIASGAWDVGTTGTGGAVLGAVGYDLKIIGYSVPDENTVDLWVRADSPLAKAPKDDKGVRGTAADWKGKTILCPSGTSCHMLLIATLKHLGLTEKDVTLIDSSVADSYAAFKAGTGDIVALWSPFGFSAQEKEDWVKVSVASDLGVIMPCLVVATPEAIKNDWDGVYAYLCAYLKAADYLNAHQEEAAKLLYDFEEEQGISMSESVAKLEVENRPFCSSEKNIKLFTPDKDGNCEANKIMLIFADFFKQQGKISAADYEKLEKNGMVDTSFMKKYAEEHKK